MSLHTCARSVRSYVQRNLSHIKARPKPEYTEALRDRDLKIVEPRKSNPELIEHERRRTVEVACLQLQDELEERGYVRPLCHEASVRGPFMSRFASPTMSAAPPMCYGSEATGCAMG